MPRLQFPKTNKESESLCKSKERLFKLELGLSMCLTQQCKFRGPQGQLWWGYLFFYHFSSCGEGFLRFRAPDYLPSYVNKKIHNHIGKQLGNSVSMAGSIETR